MNPITETELELLGALIWLRNRYKIEAIKPSYDVTDPIDTLIKQHVSKTQSKVAAIKFFKQRCLRENSNI